MLDSHETTAPVGLKADAVGLGGDFIASVVNVAPSSSVAFTLAVFLGMTGGGSPLPVLVCGVAMVFCAFGFARLNRWRASAGAAYLWVGASVNPTVGVGTGFFSIVTELIANANNVILAGTYLLFVLFFTHTAPNILVWLSAAVVMGLMLWVSIRGIRPSVRVQLLLMAIEYSVVISFVVLALIHEASGAGGATLPSLSNFNPSSSLHGFQGIAEAAVVASFLYGSWETASALGEESKHSRFNPGRAMILGTVFLTIWYTFLIMVFDGVSSRADLIAHGADAFAYAGTLLAGNGFAGRLLPIAVLFAVIGTTQMMLIQPSRILYSLSRDKLIGGFWGVVHKDHQTPWVALVILACIPMVIMIPYLVSASASTVIEYFVGTVGMLYLFLYFVIAVSSVWFFRAHITKSAGNFFLGGLLPLLGGLFCILMFAYGLTTQSIQVSVLSIVLVVVCYAGGVAARIINPKAPFFVGMARLRATGRTEAEIAAGLEAAEEGGDASVV